jgi:hypothetical protein
MHVAGSHLRRLQRSTTNPKSVLRYRKQRPVVVKKREREETCRRGKGKEERHHHTCEKVKQ